MGTEKRSAADFLPEDHSFSRLKEAARQCRGCDLYANATQTVFGYGSLDATVVFIGEQPGDKEDRVGEPFVGPAGRLLVRAAREAGLQTNEMYLTNAVKHFKWEPRGKRRIHKRPKESEIEACRPWLQAELALLQPKVVVCLGVTAARSVFGKTIRLRDYRGSFHTTTMAPLTFVTTHPAALVRIEDDRERERQYQTFVKELRYVAIQGLQSRHS